jgi:hypothetical protein
MYEYLENGKGRRTGAGIATNLYLMRGFQYNAYNAYNNYKIYNIYNKLEFIQNAFPRKKR